MTAALVLAVLVAALSLSALVWVLWSSSRSGLLAQRTRKRVIVTLDSGTTFTGVLWDADADCVVLRQAEALAYGRDGADVLVDGEALLLRSTISFVQLPGVAP